MTKVISVTIAKISQSIDIDFDTMPDSSRDFIFNYGIRQYLNDAVAGESDADKGLEKVMARMAKLESGDLSARAGRESDPIKVEMKALARNAVRNAIRKAGKKVSDYEDQITTLIENYLSKHGESVRATAQANVAARKSAESVSLEDLA